MPPIWGMKQGIKKDQPTETVLMSFYTWLLEDNNEEDVQDMRISIYELKEAMKEYIELLQKS